jgi:Flp pilus assembly protein TadG
MAQPIGSTSQQAQALAEFAIISTVLILMLAGAIEFGMLFGHKIELANGARAGARWAASHSTSWSAAGSPASNSIEGQILAAGGTTQLANDDSHITIEYFDNSGSSAVLCGHYSAASNSFVAQTGYTQSTCVTAGALVKVTLTSSYPLLTRSLGASFGSAVTVKSVAAMVLTA